MAPRFNDTDSAQDRLLVHRAEHSHEKLRGRPFWVATASYAARTIESAFNPHDTKPIPYVSNGSEQRVLTDLVREGVPVVLTGPPGIGKTTLIQNVFRELRIPLQTFVASASTQVHELLGREGLMGEQDPVPVWQDGVLSLAARAASGGLLNGFYLDEVIRLPHVVASCLYSLIDARQTFYAPTGEELRLGGRLRMVFSYNPSREVRLDDALRSRLTAIRLGYPAEEVETSVLTHGDIGRLTMVGGADIARSLVRFANAVRSAMGCEVDCDAPEPSETDRSELRKLSGPPSTRTLIVAARMISRGDYTVADAAEYFLLPSLAQDLPDHEMRGVMRALRHIVRETIGGTPTNDSIADERPIAFDFGSARDNAEMDAIAAEALRRLQRRRSAK